jgi:hypothetical protein
MDKSQGSGAKQIRDKVNANSSFSDNLELDDVDTLLLVEFRDKVEGIPQQ